MIAPAEQVPRLDKYEIVEEIGHGGMAMVYRAWDRRLHRDVAIKIIHRHLRENTEVAARFVSEARAVAKVKHPNIVEVYDVSDQDEPERYLVVELVRGTTLRKLLQRHGHMPAEVAAALVIEVAAGLEHAHRQGVIHRDVKPENVLVELPSTTAISGRDSAEVTSEARNARIKITDFGIAKLLDGQGVTSTGQVLGSPAHMAPEQIEGGDVSARSDVFGLGVLLYECLVGALPFDGKNPAQVLRRVLDGKYTPADRARPTVGLALSRILDGALAHEASERYESAERFARELGLELARLGFDDPRRELAEYLVDPDAYRASYEPRVVARLVERGRAARKERDMPLAAACFNRALAFRPDDVELLAQVAGLARMQRMKRLAFRLGGIAAMSAVLGFAAFGLSRALRQPPTSPPGARNAPREAEVSAVSAPKPEARAPAVVEPEAKEPTQPQRASRRAQGAAEAEARRKAAASPPQQIRKVMIQAEPGNVRVRVNGEEIKWFGSALSLPIGEHTFEFIPGDDTCCVGAITKRVMIEPGTDVQQVRGKLEYRPASIVFPEPKGAVASCGLLGDFTAPGHREVPMEKADYRVSCRISPPQGSGGDMKTIDVRLKPGREFVLRYDPQQSTP